MADEVDQIDSESKATPSGYSVGSLVERFDGRPNHSSYTVREERRVTINTSTTTEFNSTYGVDTRYIPNGSKSARSLVSNPTARLRAESNSGVQGSPDFGIMRMEFPDSVVTLPHLNDPKKEGPYGVSKAVHKALLTAISQDTTECVIDINDHKRVIQNLMSEMQWSLCAPEKLNPNPPIPPPKPSTPPMSTRKLKGSSHSHPRRRKTAHSNSISQDTDCTTSSDTSTSDCDSVQLDDPCYSTTFSPYIGSFDPGPAKDPITQHHLHPNMSCETVMVQLWYTIKNVDDHSLRPGAAHFIQERVTAHVADILIGPCAKTRAKYRVFVVMTQMPDNSF